MNNRLTHSKTAGSRTRSGIVRIALLLGFALLFVHSNSKAQVISNKGAAISIDNGIAVNADSVDVESGSITNEGSLYLTRSLINADTIDGRWFLPDWRRLDQHRNI